MQKKSLIILVMCSLFSWSIMLNAMDEVNRKIEKLREDYVVKLNTHKQNCDECQHGYYCEYDRLSAQNLNGTRNQLVLRAYDLLTDQEKLDNLVGDHLYYKRKKIIARMIVGSTNPNDIKYQYDYTPFYECVLFQDIDFGKYLIEHGAKPDAKTMRIVKPLVDIAQRRFDKAKKDYDKHHDYDGYHHNTVSDCYCKEYLHAEQMYHVFLNVAHSCSPIEIYYRLKNNGLCADIIKHIIFNYAMLNGELSFARSAFKLENYYTKPYEEKEIMRKEFFSQLPLKQLI